MKKFISLAAAAMAVVLCFCACGSENVPVVDQATASEVINDEDTPTASGQNANESLESAGRLKIVTTIFPEYDWVREVLGEKAQDADLFMLLDNGVDLHSYQPNAEDIMNISNCDLFIYVGGESDEWVEDALKEKVNENMVVINLLETLGDSVKEEELVEGMEGEEEEEEGEEEGEEEEGPEYDEHVWLSVKNARVIVGKIAESLEALDPSDADIYKANADNYNQKLSDLDAAYEEAVSEATCKTLVFGDRFPFRYLVDDYGLSYYAAFVGCSAETETSFETIAFLAGKVDELGLKYVVTIEGADHKIAETIISNTGDKDRKILTMDSLQSTTSKDVQSGTTYLGVMEQNLEVLKEALN